MGRRARAQRIHPCPQDQAPDSMHARGEVACARFHLACFPARCIAHPTTAHVCCRPSCAATCAAACSALNSSASASAAARKKGDHVNAGEQCSADSRVLLFNDGLARAHENQSGGCGPTCCRPRCPRCHKLASPGVLRLCLRHRRLCCKLGCPACGERRPRHARVVHGPAAEPEQYTSSTISTQQPLHSW